MMKRFCPRCKSTSVEWRDSRFGAGEGNWVCFDCGFYNIVFPERESQNSIKDSVRNKEISKKSCNQPKK
ncbi:MAG: hypothetical protein KC516_03150 [Nanoarchaeota archaeon]|nr:hypothetical protein [Nanoarchaeota archaeon]